MKTKSKIRKQILFMAISIATIWCIVMGVYLFVFSNEYQDMNIQQSNKILGMFVYNFDEDLKEYEKLIFNFVSDDNIYDNLYKVNFAQEQYEQYMANRKLDDALALQLKKYHHISTIYYIQNDNDVILSSISNEILPDNEVIEMVNSTNNHTKNITWIKPSLNDKNAYIIRNVQKTEFDWNSSLGTLVIAIDIDQITDDILAYTQDLDGYYLSNDNELIILGEQYTTPMLLDINLKGNKTQIVKHENEYLLLSKYISKYNDWEYINVMNYSLIMQNIFNMVILMLAILLLGLFATVIYGLGITQNIMRPIRALTNKANKAIEGEYEVEKIDEPKLDDEIGILEYDFNYMLKNIDYLINENFVQEIQSRDYQYRMLQAQINPHLLYNTLEIVSWRARMNGDKETARIVYALGKLLRNSINNSQLIITLRQELEILDYYIQIEEHRYEERLNINFAVEEKHLKCSIPKLILQPIVENAIKYGVECKIEGANIIVTSREIDNKLIIEVKDDGIGMSEDIRRKLLTPESISKGTGIGIKNIHNRIRTQYGQDYGLQIDSQLGISTTVRIILPLDNTDSIKEEGET